MSTPYEVHIQQRADDPAAAAPPPSPALEVPYPGLPPTPPATGAAVPAPVPPRGPRLPRRTTVVELPQEHYPGFTLTVWVNFPQRLLGEINSGDQARGAAALGQIVLAHNGWCDEEGEPYPPSTEPAFWDAVPTELAAMTIALVQREAMRLPNSLVATRRG